MSEHDEAQAKAHDDKPSTEGWHLAPKASPFDLPRVVDAQDRLVCHFGWEGYGPEDSGPGTPPSPDHLRWMILAPRLLAALENVMEYHPAAYPPCDPFDPEDCGICEAVAVIAEARGIGIAEVKAGWSYEDEKPGGDS